MCYYHFHCNWTCIQVQILELQVQVQFLKNMDSSPTRVTEVCQQLAPTSPNVWSLNWVTVSQTVPTISTFAMINSASSGLPSCSLSATSASDIREYDRLIMRTPVLMTLWRRRTIRVYVPSAENLSEYVVSVWLKLFRLPVRTANHNKNS